MSEKFDLADLALLRGIGQAMSAKGYSPDGALVIDAADALAAQWARADGALALLNEHRCSDAAERAYERAARAEARADQAASQAVREYAEALRHNPNAENWGWSEFVRSAYEWANWKSAAPTAEQ